MIHRKVSKKHLNSSLTPTFASRGLTSSVPRFIMPKSEMDPRNAKQLVHDELMLDGNSRLNLATFVTTWMEPEARELMELTFDKNMIDKDEYPQTAELEMRCVNMLAHLWHAPEHGAGVGCSTIGSSEAAMLGGMALKWRWRERMKAQGKPIDKPNMVMGINVQVCWEKFCRYWDIEARYVPMDGDRYCLNAEETVKLCDENTIGVVAIMGTTFTGEYEPVEEISKALDNLQKDTGLNIPIHVDAASGGFVTPFIQPKIVWDFKLERVKSINASGHKYGLVYPGVGWVVWREAEDLPDDLVFKVNYLGGEMPTFALNFSRPGNQVVAQYYNLIRLGFDGYRRIQQACSDTAQYLSKEISKLGPFSLISDGSAIPVFAFQAKDDAGFTVFDFSEAIRHRGWLIPAYTMPENNESVAALRIVVKEGFSRDMADMLLDDMRHVLKTFAENKGYQPKGTETTGKVRC